VFEINCGPWDLVRWLCVVAEAQSMGEVLKVQNKPRIKGVWLTTHTTSAANARAADKNFGSAGISSSGSQCPRTYADTDQRPGKRRTPVETGSRARDIA
jgi:hypothetical protein